MAQEAKLSPGNRAEGADLGNTRRGARTKGASRRCPRRRYYQVIEVIVSNLIDSLPKLGTWAAGRRSGFGRRGRSFGPIRRRKQNYRGRSESPEDGPQACRRRIAPAARAALHTPPIQATQARRPPSPESNATQSAPRGLTIGCAISPMMSSRVFFLSGGRRNPIAKSAAARYRGFSTPER